MPGIEDLSPQDGYPVWIPVVVVRDSGKACICYHPWRDDDGCACVLPPFPEKEVADDV